MLFITPFATIHILQTHYSACTTRNRQNEVTKHNIFQLVKTCEVCQIGFFSLYITIPLSGYLHSVQLLLNKLTERMVAKSLKGSIKSPLTLLTPCSYSIQVILFLLSQTLMEGILSLTLIDSPYISPILCIMKESLDIATPSVLTIEDVKSTEIVVTTLIHITLT